MIPICGNRREGFLLILTDLQTRGSICLWKKCRLRADTAAAMEQELYYLQTFRWKEIEKMLEVAKILGNLSENAEYDFAITERDKCLERINNIKHILAHAVIIDEGE